MRCQRGASGAMNFARNDRFRNFHGAGHGDSGRGVVTEALSLRGTARIGSANDPGESFYKKLLMMDGWNY